LNHVVNAVAHRPPILHPSGRRTSSCVSLGVATDVITRDIQTGRVMHSAPGHVSNLIPRGGLNPWLSLILPREVLTFCLCLAFNHYYAFPDNPPIFKPSQLPRRFGGTGSWVWPLTARAKSRLMVHGELADSRLIRARLYDSGRKHWYFSACMIETSYLLKLPAPAPRNIMVPVGVVDFSLPMARLGVTARAFSCYQISRPS
jgi:hypothetical protein